MLAHTSRRPTSADIGAPAVVVVAAAAPPVVRAAAEDDAGRARAAAGCGGGLPEVDANVPLLAEASGV